MSLRCFRNARIDLIFLGRKCQAACPAMNPINATGERQLFESGMEESRDSGGTAIALGPPFSTARPRRRERSSRNRPRKQAQPGWVIRLVFLVIAMLAGALSGAELTFDAWVDAFSSEWVRGDPMLATLAQYFDDAEQD